jgi:hypothetical protein
MAGWDVGLAHFLEVGRFLCMSCYEAYSIRGWGYFSPTPWRPYWPFPKGSAGQPPESLGPSWPGLL